MINKKSMWFVTLFSLIIVMFSVYLTLPALSNEKFNSKGSTDYTVNVKESELILALKVKYEEETMLEINALQKILHDETKSSEEKNDALDEMKNLNTNTAKEDELVKLIKDKYQLDAFIKIKHDQINVVIDSREHSYELANNIINSIQGTFESKKYITVKFETSDN